MIPHDPTPVDTRFRYWKGLALLICLVYGRLEAQTISTIAGSMAKGDGGQAINAALASPSGVAVDGSGNLYIADHNNQRIRKVAVDGTISTVAGNGTYGFSGDGSAATAASLANPSGVAVDGSGNIYIADTDNNRIRKVDGSGTITTLAGNGTAGFGGDGSAATSASLNGPLAVVVDASGAIYIADTRNNRVRKISAGTINTVAGTGTAAFGGDNGAATSANLNNPVGVAVDGSGNLYIADGGNNRVRKVVSGGTISTVVGNGTAGFGGDGSAATNASLNGVSGIAVDGSGNLYIADSYNQRIRKVDAGNTINTIAGNGSSGFSGDGAAATSAALASPAAVVVDGSGNLYIADQANNRIRKVDGSGNISTFAGNGETDFSGDGGPATSAALNSPFGVAVDGSGNFYIADQNNQRIRKITTGGTISTVAGNGSYGFGGDNGAATAASLARPSGVAVDGSGNLYIADYFNHRIRKVTTGGIITTVAGNGTAGFGGDNGTATSANLNEPSGIAVDASGNLYIADEGNHRIRKVTTGGIITTVAGNGTAGFGGDNGAATSANLANPKGVAVDGQGTLYIADYGNQRIRKVTTGGTISTVAGTGSAGFGGDGGPAASASLNNPTGVAVDAYGYVFIADQNNQRIRQIATDGTMSTIAGSGTPGFSGDGGTATAASLNQPSGVTIDGNRNVYLADTYNNRIRRVTPASPDLTPSLLLPQGNFAASGEASIGRFIVSIFEVANAPTSTGNITVTITAPLGYTLAFDNTLTSIDVSGGTNKAVDNPKWSIISPGSGQISLQLNAGQAISAGGKSVLGFTITRTFASGGSTSNLTVNVSDDASKTYDSVSANNIYVRVLNGI